MKKINFSIIGILIVFAVAFWSCEDRTDLTEPGAPSLGNADFSTFVSFGNSLTAGYQNGALYESTQKYSFGNLIAQQVGANYVQPLISDPGIPGRLEVKSIEPFEVVTNTTLGQPKNTSYGKPYNNLGIPGALLVDFLQAKDASTSISGDNIFFDIVLRGNGTELEQAISLKPTFMTLWVGNNDILGYATRGGTVPHTPTDLFAQLYGQLAGAIATQTNAKVVVANIPGVQAVPYFTTVGPGVAQAIKPAVDAGLAVGVFYNTNGQIGATAPNNVATVDALVKGDVLLTLTLSSYGYTDLIGQPTGKFYRDNGIDPALVGADTTKPFGLHPANPIPDAFVLDPAEIQEVNNTVESFNQTIAGIASANGWALVDVNAFFKQTAANGYVANGVKFTTQYVTGGLFSLDGVHPTSQGYAIIANLFIDKINEAFGANIPKVNVTTIPGSLVLAKVSFDKYGIPKLDKNAFANFPF